MSKSFTNTIAFKISLVITLLFISCISFATMQISHATPGHSLVLGLRHSRATLRTPKKLSEANARLSTSFPNKQSQPFTMMEPLRAVRDGFLLPLYIGTPPQVIQVYMDTGSDLTWVPCGNSLAFDCIDCDDYRTNNRLTSMFSPFSSSTAVRETCGSSYCIDVHSSDNYIDTCTVAGCSLGTLIKSSCSRPCPSFAYTYGAGGVVTGLLTRDTLRVHENIFSTNFTKEIPKFSFGCVGSTYREPIGIAGFGRGTLSLPSQLGLMKKSFSHCFLPFMFADNPNISSPLVIGDFGASSNSDESMQFTPMLRSPMYPSYYYIGLDAITVGNSSSTQLPLSLRQFDSQGNGGMLIDSGTTYTHLPEPIYSQLLSTLQSLVSFPRAEDVESRTGFDLCYKIPYTKSTNTTTEDQPESLPPITFHFLNNVSLVLTGGSHFYKMGAPRNSTVVKCLLIQRMEDGDYGPAGVFGSFQQQNVKVVYDLENERIGFHQMNCASFAVPHGLYRKP